MKTVEIYTDGSSLGNPGPGGWACILAVPGAEKVMAGGEAETTNNRMELTAAIRALEALKEPCEAVIHTDSKYLADSIMLGWAERWKRNGWKRADRSPALNTDLWDRLLSLSSSHSVRFVWVKGHDGNSLNERCDLIARSYAAAFTGKK